MAPRGISEQSFFVLAALAGGTLHGYAIITEVRSLSEGRLRLPVGTLYGILDRLAAGNAIEVDREEVVDSRLRRYYRLADPGRQLLASEAARLAANARLASERLAQLRPRVAGPA